MTTAPPRPGAPTLTAWLARGLAIGVLLCEAAPVLAQVPSPAPAPIVTLSSPSPSTRRTIDAYLNPSRQATPALQLNVGEQIQFPIRVTGRAQDGFYPVMVDNRQLWLPSRQLVISSNVSDRTCLPSGISRTTPANSNPGISDRDCP